MIYFDTSYLLKCYLAEPDTKRCANWLRRRVRWRASVTVSSSAGPVSIDICAKGN